MSFAKLGLFIDNGKCYIANINNNNIEEHRKYIDENTFSKLEKNEYGTEEYYKKIEEYYNCKHEKKRVNKYEKRRTKVNKKTNEYEYTYPYRQSLTYKCVVCDKEFAIINNKGGINEERKNKTST